MPEKDIFIEEVQPRIPFYRRLMHLFHSSTQAAGVMLLAAIAALIVANVGGIHEGFLDFWHTELGVFFGENEVEMSLSHIINDILMALFFLLVGLEIKYEMTVGELTNIRQAILPIIGAAGGVLVPIIIYLAFNAGNPDTSHGWGVPMATDIAFALGILALLGSRVPAGVKVFLSTLAVADDIIAILVIAVFYGDSPSLVWLGGAAIVMVLLILLNRRHVYSLVPYMLLGAVLWYCVYMSGVHSTIAGVLLAFAIPSGSQINLKGFISWSGKTVKEANEAFDEESPVSTQKDYMTTVEKLSNVAKRVVPPAVRLEKKLYPWVYFAVLPLFALTNADVAFMGGDMGSLFSNPALYGIFFGLLLGKPIGIVLFSFIIVKSKIAHLPEHTNWGHMLGAGILGGVGFTMAIFVANLAFVDESVITAAKVGILSASLIAGVVGFLVLWIQANKAKKKGICYDNEDVGVSETPIVDKGEVIE